MLSIAHTLISLPLGLALNNPFLIFILAFLLHLGADSVLHWNIYPQNYKRYPFVLVGLDVLSGLVVSYALLGNAMLAIPVLAAIAGGNAPDVLHALWSFMKDSTKNYMPRSIHAWFAFHKHIQRETESPLRGGLSQVIFCSLAVILTLLLR